jgi:hypothetical protein
MRTVLNGLTRGLPLEVIDRGYGEQSGAAVYYYPTTNALGLVMPSNSPAVNSLWLPAIALKTPVIIMPGREEPWTPYRLIQAFIAPPAYVGQLALYRAVLARLYPDRTVRAALVWTETMELMEIPGDRLDAALAELVSS